MSLLCWPLLLLQPHDVVRGAEEMCVDAPHLEAVPRVGALTARRLPGRDVQRLQAAAVYVRLRGGPCTRKPSDHNQPTAVGLAAAERTFVGRRTGPLTLRCLSLAPRIRSADTAGC
jgi:hypothetical protein